MNNYKKYLKYKYKYYALKKQIGGEGEVVITSLTFYNDPSLEPLERKTYDDKVSKGFIPYSAKEILDRLQPNKLYAANILNTSNKHTGFIIETNDKLNKGIDKNKFLEYRGEDKLVIYIKCETQTNYFTNGKFRDKKYINTILHTNQTFNDALKKILMGQPYTT